MRRGHETAQHIAMKETLREWLLAEGYLVKAEESLADLVAFRPGQPGIVAIECERSTRNAIANIRRDLKNGATDVLVVADSAATARKITGLVAKKLPHGKRRRVAVRALSNLPNARRGVGDATDATRQKKED